MSSFLKNSNALFYLGKMYYFGIGVEQNYIKSMQYFSMAANSKAKFFLGVYYENIDHDLLKFGI